MQVSITKAAKLAGVSRTTLYNDMNSGKLTFISSGKNKKLLDVAELERVYGSLTLEADDKTSSSTKSEQKQTKTTEQAPALVELAVLRERLDTLEKERAREREQLVERIEHLQESLNKAQENQTKTTLLLEHYTKEGGSSDNWQKAISALEDRIQNQEKANQEEKSKGFFKRLFG